jgi:hypothetical protein
MKRFSGIYLEMLTFELGGGRGQGEGGGPPRFVKLLFTPYI